MVDLKEERADVRRLTKRGTEYYTNAPLEEGITTNPSRVFQESVGTYVGYRVRSYWRTLGLLTNHELGLRDRSRSQQLVVNSLTAVKNARRRYEQEMAQRVFGYQDKAWFKMGENETTKPMSGDLKAFADQNLLEGKVPDGFMSSPALSAIWRRLRERHSAFLDN